MNDQKQVERGPPPPRRADADLANHPPHTPFRQRSSGRTTERGVRATGRCRGESVTAIVLHLEEQLGTNVCAPVSPFGKGCPRTGVLPHAPDAKEHSTALPLPLYQLSIAP